MELPKRFIKSRALQKAEKESHRKPDGYVWLLWTELKDGNRDCIWTIKITKGSYRFFETAEAAEAYYALSGTEKRVDDTWQVNERFGVNVVRPRGQGVVKFVI